MTTLREKLDRDAQAFWDDLRAEKNANPPRPREVVVETSHTVETQKIAVPQDERLQGGQVGGGGGTPPAICEGDINDFFVGLVSSGGTYAILTALPYNITVKAVALYSGGETIGASLFVSTGGGTAAVPTALSTGTVTGTNISEIDGIVGPGVVGEITLLTNEFIGTGAAAAYSFDQMVPIGGSVSLSVDNVTGATEIHIWIHYTYHCADGSPL